MSQEYSLDFIDSLAELTAEEWNGLIGSDYPFLKHEFLYALESSGCTSSQTGWLPRHLLVRNAQNVLVAMLPLYLKSNSMGEYVFDWSWADAYYRHGLNYYPKFVTAIPFTPSPGPRICIAADQDETKILGLIFEKIKLAATRLQASSWHVLFPEKTRYEQLHGFGLQQRLGCQYQWFNRDYESFQHFLQGFASRKRKNIRKEREKISQAGIVFEWLEGHQITPELWQHFYRFYQHTYLVRGRSAYLNLPFFMELGRVMPQQILLIMAKLDDRYIAAALCFRDADTLYGRYWGSDEEWQFLHFETCYYQGIEYCIQHRLRRFDSGAQGEHKIQRGFEPVSTYSSHWISHPEFSAAIEHFLEEEKQHLEEYREYAAEHLPFKKDGD